MRNLPFRLTPVAQKYIWGGTRLNDDFCLDFPVEPFAEAWVCSTHLDGESTVNGIPLSEILYDHPEWIGTHPLYTMSGKPRLPILIKLIDAKYDLSVQVHPDDEYAMKEEGQLGKTEMWYVLDAKPNSTLVYGFINDVNAEQVRNAIASGTIESLLNHVPIHKDDVFFIDAGTVHAIGAGALIAEIQESSNITYRLYDYDRIGEDGKKRKLNIEKALNVANLRSSFSPRQPMRVLKYKKGFASELLTRCKYFQVERIIPPTYRECKGNSACFLSGLAKTPPG